MFEDATFDSTGLKGGQTGRWWIVALGLNVTVLTGAVMAPLLWPKGLPVFVSVRELAVPAPGRVLDVQRQISQPASASPQSIVFRQVLLAAPMTPSTHVDPVTAPPDTGGDIFGRPITGAGNLPSGVADSTGAGVFAQPKPVIVAAKPGRFKVSGGVTEGLLLSKVSPVYPIIARTAGISGIVVLAASISKDGRIEALRVVSGNEMLTRAAIEAVEQWRYRPYLLNGEPVEVETTVKVVFSLGRN
jgi:protein TonB